jgi:DNA primase
VILSHIGRAVKEGQAPKYLFYEGFHKSSELYGQELIWLHEDAAEQIQQIGSILLTEGPFDVAKAVDAGLRNAVSSFGASLSKAQATKLADMAKQFGISRIIIAYDRDEAGQNGAAKAETLLKEAGLDPILFDWDAPLGRNKTGIVTIPQTINDLCDFSSRQIAWLRAHGKL